MRQIVEGETRFSKITQVSEKAGAADVKAMDLQQLFLAMTKELRIVVVKLADRLHNMRTLGSLPPEKQRKIATETLQVCCWHVWWLLMCYRLFSTPGLLSHSAYKFLPCKCL